MHYVMVNVAGGPDPELEMTRLASIGDVLRNVWPADAKDAKNAVARFLESATPGQSLQIDSQQCVFVVGELADIFKLQRTTQIVTETVCVSSPPAKKRKSKK
jgi:hypothetical protein